MISSVLLTLALLAPVQDPPPDHPVSCDEHPEPYEGDIPCGFVDGEPEHGDWGVVVIPEDVEPVLPAATIPPLVIVAPAAPVVVYEPGFTG